MTAEQDAEHSRLGLLAAEALAGGLRTLAQQYKERMRALRGVGQADMDVTPIPVSGVCTPSQHKSRTNKTKPRGREITVRDGRSSDAIGREIADGSVAMVSTSTDGRFYDLYRRHG